LKATTAGALQMIGWHVGTQTATALQTPRKVAAARRPRHLKIFGD
jgi:hypothetical protein